MTLWVASDIPQDVTLELAERLGEHHLFAVKGVPEAVLAKAERIAGRRV